MIEAAHRLIDIYSSGITNTSVTFTLARVFNALGKLDQTRQILQKLIDDTTFGQRNVDASLPFLLPIPSHGNTVHVFDRECSVQRRHQKVIEEAPSSLLTEELRAKMAETAIKAAEA